MKETINDSDEFMRYRQQMHHNDEDNRPRPAAPRSLRLIFSIFMILIYIGMGVLMFINFFDMPAKWDWARYVVGVVLIIYALFRGYREYKGIDHQY